MKTLEEAMCIAIDMCDNEAKNMWTRRVDPDCNQNLVVTVYKNTSGLWLCESECVVKISDMAGGIYFTVYPCSTGAEICYDKF